MFCCLALFSGLQGTSFEPIRQQFGVGYRIIGKYQLFEKRQMSGNNNTTVSQKLKLVINTSLKYRESLRGSQSQNFHHQW